MAARARARRRLVVSGTPPRIEARDLAYGHGGVAVGRGVSFAVAPGEALFVLGPNGGGKTTLFRTLLGLLPPLAGAVLLDGEDAARLGPRARARAVGYVPQAGPGGFPFLVEEAVLMGRTAHRGPFSAPSRADRAAAAAAMEAAGVSHLAGRA